MFVIKCYNDKTGRIETVSDVRKDAADEGFTDPDLRRHTADMFAAHDTNTDHVYYAVTV